MAASNPDSQSQAKPEQKFKRPILARIFLSPEERRLRAGWRLFIQTIMWQVLAAGMAFGLIVIGVHFEFDNLFLNKTISLVALLISVYTARKLLDRRSFISLGLKVNFHSLKDLLLGIGIAGLMMGLIYVLEWMAGWLKFEAFAWDTYPAQTVFINVFQMFGLFILVAFDEEILSRGYQLQNLEEGINLLWGVILSSLIFSAMHNANPNFSIGALFGLFAAGLFLAFAYVITRQLWLPIGIHIGWNFFEGTVFGFQVSGLDTFRLIEQNVKGPDFLTGGLFGPEAGLVLVPAMALGVLCIYIVAKRNHKIHSYSKIES